METCTRRKEKRHLLAMEMEAVWKLYGSCHAAACCGMLWHAAGHLLQLLKVFWGPVCRLVHLQFKQVGIGNQPVISNLEPYIIYIYKEQQY